MWVTPIALGTGLVATHVIDKQSEVRLIQPAPSSYTDARLGLISNQLNRIELSLPPSGQTDSSTREIRDRLDTFDREVAVLSNEVSTIVDITRSTKTDIAILQDRADMLTVQVTNVGQTKSNSTLTVDPKVLATFDSAIKDLGQSGVNALANGFTVFLGNASPQHPASITANTGFHLNLQDSDLNLHQGIYPVLNTSPIETSSPVPPFLLAFDRGEKTISVPSITGALEGWDHGSMDLCTDTIPYIIVLRQSATKQSSTECRAYDVKAQNPAGPAPSALRQLSITKTPQYVKEIHSYVSLDTTSGREYWLFGDRRVVLEIAPARN